MKLVEVTGTSFIFHFALAITRESYPHDAVHVVPGTISGIGIGKLICDLAVNIYCRLNFILVVRHNVANGNSYCKNFRKRCILLTNCFINDHFAVFSFPDNHRNCYGKILIRL